MFQRAGRSPSTSSQGGGLGLADLRRQWAINEVFTKYALAACIKTALQLQGFDVGDAIAPQEALKPEAVEEIRHALALL